MGQPQGIARTCLNIRNEMNISELKVKPALDGDFLPASLWHRAYDEMCAVDDGCRDIVIGLGRPDGSMFRHEMRVLSASNETEILTLKAVERVVKFMLWQKGGATIYIGGAPEVGEELQKIYSKDGERAFDNDLIGKKVFDRDFEVVICDAEDVPAAKDSTLPLGRHLDGCRIGFDLGGSDRKCAAVIDGKVVFSEEVKWDPYFEKDPDYHYAGIIDSLKLAAEHLPRVDAIGGSAAGVYVDNEPRIASLFRGVSEDDFAEKVRPMFKNIRSEWNDIPFDVVNDGEVTALAGAMSLNDTGVLGVALGTSEAAGYCDAAGSITTWLNELAFTPVDYRENGPADEWAGDEGCGVQYFSQQAVARLIPEAGIEVSDDMPLPERLEHVQALMADGDERAAKIYDTIGVYLGYSLAWYAEFYEIKHLLLLGRVTSGEGGQIIIHKAEEVLAAEFPQLKISISMPDEKMKRHGQAIAAASLASL